MAERRFIKADFKVGDEIEFYISGDEKDVVDLTGEIIKIEGEFATVRHEYGTCRVHLSAAKHKA